MKSPENSAVTGTRGELDRDTALALKLWVVLSRASTALEEHVRQDVARHNLTPTEFAILEALFHKGPLLLGEVQQKILISSGGITYVVDRLEEKGLVQRRRCETDRRAYYASLTEAGQSLMQRIFPEHADRIAWACSGLDAEEKAVAIDLIRRLGRTAADKTCRQ